MNNEGCPDKQIGTCHGCPNKECLDKLIAEGVCLVHGVTSCACEPVRDEHGHYTTQIVPANDRSTSRSKPESES